MNIRSAAITLAILAPWVSHPTWAEQSFVTFTPTPLEREVFNGPGVTVTEGKDIFATICAGCHMPEGQGAKGAGAYPALAGNPNLEVADYPIFVVVNGQKAMPPLGSFLSDAQVAAVVNFIQSNLGNGFEPGATAEAVAAVRPANKPSNGEH